MLAGVGTVEVMDAVHADDAMEEDNTIETNGSESGEPNGLSLNGDDSNDSFVNQLSIDTGDIIVEPPTPNKPTIRIAKGLHKSPEIKSRSSSPAKVNMKRKSTSSSSNGVSSKKLRPSLAESEADIASLEKEVRALQWLARRKEQEWDQAVRLLKQKEEKLIRALRNKSLASIDNEPAKLRLSLEATSSPSLVQPQPVIVPQQQVMLLPQQPVSRIIAPKVTQVVRPVVATSPSTVRSSKSPSPASRTTQPQRPLSNNSATSASGDLSEAKFATVLQKASKNLQKASSQGKKEEKKNTPQCQGCGNKKSEFVCAGCSNRWYCSRECQVEDWDEHADECAG